MNKQNGNNNIPAVDKQESFDLVGLSAGDLTDILDSLLQQGKDSLYVKVYAIAHNLTGEKMSMAGESMHKRKFELNITRKGKKG
jgi:hypothetical protein